MFFRTSESVYLTAWPAHFDTEAWNFPPFFHPVVTMVILAVNFRFNLFTSQNVFCYRVYMQTVIWFHLMAFFFPNGFSARVS